MDPGVAPARRDPESFRAFLTNLAAWRLDPRLQSKLDPADLVQQTLLEAYQAIAQYPDGDEFAQKAWLRRILLHNIANAVRDLGRQKRDVNREQSLDAAIAESSARLLALLAAEQSSPSDRAARAEQALALEEALAALPEAQRQALVLRYFHGWPLDDIRRELGRSASAVAGLLHRGLTQLRELLPQPE